MSHYTIFEEKNLIFYRPEGILTMAAIQEFIDDLLKDPAYRENMLEFIDLSRVDKWDIKLEELRSIFNREISKVGKRTIIDKMSIWAPSDIAFGITRMFHSVASFHSMEIYIHRDEEQALQFLNINKNDLRKSERLLSPCRNSDKITSDK